MHVFTAPPQSGWRGREAGSGSRVKGALTPDGSQLRLLRAPGERSARVRRESGRLSVPDRRQQCEEGQWGRAAQSASHWMRHVLSLCLNPQAQCGTASKLSTNDQCETGPKQIPGNGRHSWPRCAVRPELPRQRQMTRACPFLLQNDLGKQILNLIQKQAKSGLSHLELINTEAVNCDYHRPNVSDLRGSGLRLCRLISNR